MVRFISAAAVCVVLAACSDPAKSGTTAANSPTDSSAQGPGGSAQGDPGKTNPPASQDRADALAGDAAKAVPPNQPADGAMPVPPTPLIQLNNTSNDPKDYPGLKIESLKAGDGKELVAGKQAKVHYIGTLLNGREFDSTWSKPGAQPAVFGLEVGQVVDGFRVGLLGMKVGERRRVTIPGAYGYKEAGEPRAGIGSNETLIFDVELVDVVDPVPPVPAALAPNQGAPDASASDKKDPTKSADNK